MTSHIALMVSIVFATLMRDDPAQQLRFGARLFAGFVGAGLVIGWLLYPLPL